MEILRKIIFLFCLLLIPLAVNAQDIKKDHALSDSSKALEFLIAENFTLKSFTGSAFSYKWNVSKLIAYRIGFGINSSLSRRENEPNPENEDKTSHKELGLNINLFRIHYYHPDNEIKFYYGQGPRLGYRYESTKHEYEFSNQSTRTTRNNNFNFSLLSLAGVEWFFHSSISLHAEYALSIGIELENSKEKIDNEFGDNFREKNDNISFHLRGNGVKFGLSVYF